VKVHVLNKNEMAAFKVVFFTAVIRVVTQSGERRCVTTLITAVKKTTFKGEDQLYYQIKMLHVL